VAYEFASLVPEIRPFGEALLAQAGAAGLLPRVTSTLRSYSDQQELYRRYVAGISPYPAAPPGASAHEYGLAFDMDVVPHSALADLGALWQSWGGGWGGARDPVHFELPGASAAALAAYQAAGGAISPPPATKTPPRFSKAHAASLLVDIALGFVPVVGELELAGAIVSLGFPQSEVAQFLSGPVEWLQSAGYL
jgi:hypothetical protein